MSCVYLLQCMLISLRSCSYTIKISVLHMESRNDVKCSLQFGCVSYYYKACAKNSNSYEFLISIVIYQHNLQITY